VLTIKNRKLEQLRKNPHGTSMNGHTKNAPLRLDEDEMNMRTRTLRDRKTIEHQRRKKNQKIKKQPLPDDQMEEFMGLKPIDPSKRRAWNLDEAEFLRFQSASRHSANNVRHSANTRHSANNVRHMSPLRLHQLRIDDNNDDFHYFLCFFAGHSKMVRKFNFYEKIDDNYNFRNVNIVWFYIFIL
jgi:hypothetical protein